MSRIYIEQIVERARDIRRLEADRPTTRAALLDITLDVALAVVTKTHTLVEQAVWSDVKKRTKIMRQLRTDWKAIAKGVKLTYDDHPIADRHIYVTMAAYYPTLLRSHEAMFNCELTGDEYMRLQRCNPRTGARAVVRDILSQVG